MKVCVLGGAGLQPCVYAAVQHAALAAEVHSVLAGENAPQGLKPTYFQVP
jgi:hypothetical protein